MASPRTSATRSGRHKRPTAPAKKPRKGFFRRTWWVFLLLLPLLGLAAFAGTVYYVYVNLDVPEAPPLAQTSQLLDRHGTPITTFHADEDRKIIPLDQMPEHLRQAVIATEDHDFYEHGGISPVGIVRALWTNVTKGELVEGGSTITQQYVKQVFTGADRTLTRKLKEALLAVKLESEYSKDEILEKYLNTIYFGHGAYGVEAAAQTYWGIPASKLKPAQSALLAGLIQAPSALDPFDHKAAARERRAHVIERMQGEGYVTPEEAERMAAAPIKLRKQTVDSTDTSGFFAWYVRSILEQRYGEEAVTSGGLRIKTTLDGEWQRIAQEIVRDRLPGEKDPEAALVAIDPANGHILAMVGGRYYARPGQFNIATQAKRQAGSSFKTFTLAEAYEQGWSPYSGWYGPSTITIGDERCMGGDGPWTPSNADPGEAGGFSLLSATAHSVNTVFAQLVVKGSMSPDKVADMAHKLGIRSDLGDPAPCSITLGSQGVSPLEMTSAYATIANQGVYESPTAVLSVRNPDGTKRGIPRTKEREVVDPNVANAVTFSLEAVVDYGTGTAADIGRLPVAGKTGTSQDYKNAWFCGFTPPLSTKAEGDDHQVAVCVWVGYVKRERSMVNVAGVPGPVYGGTIPAGIWHDFVGEVTADVPYSDFPEPDLSAFQTGNEPEPSASPKPKKSPTPSPTKSPKPSPSPDG